MILNATLLNTQHFKVRIKGKIEQSREWSCTLSYTCIVAGEKGAFGSPSTKVASFTFLLFSNNEYKWRQAPKYIGHISIFNIF